MVFTSMKKSKFNILFLSLLDFDSLDEQNIYTDLLNEFVKNGNYVVAISPVEKRNYNGQKNIIFDEYSIMKPVIGNIQKTNILEKGFSTITLERIMIRSIKSIKTKFDLILYSTPPVTFGKCVKYIKNRDNAISYLLLKDIFPQNAIDLGIIQKNGILGFVYRYFRKKEINLYKISDFVGCMSEANRVYVIENNRINPEKVEVNPNTEQKNYNIEKIDRNSILRMYSIPSEKTIFIYGGNLGKPQGIDFIIECLKINELRDDSFILIVGSGTEYKKLYSFFIENNIKNSLLISKLPRKEFESLVQASDVGMVFLDYRFTIPNFPSRILTYMKLKKPVLMAIDRSTDIGKISKENGFGDYCYSNDVESFINILDYFCKISDNKAMGLKAYEYFLNNYISEISFNKIITKMEDKHGVN